jgi:hypothetical protein
LVGKFNAFKIMTIVMRPALGTDAAPIEANVAVKLLQKNT